MVKEVYLVGCEMKKKKIGSNGVFGLTFAILRRKFSFDVKGQTETV